jgi:hypothetical protein
VATPDFITAATFAVQNASRDHATDSDLSRRDASWRTLRRQKRVPTGALIKMTEIDRHIDQNASVR